MALIFLTARCGEDEGDSLKLIVEVDGNLTAHMSEGWHLRLARSAHERESSHQSWTSSTPIGNRLRRLYLLHLILRGGDEEC